MKLRFVRNIFFVFLVAGLASGSLVLTDGYTRSHTSGTDVCLACHDDKNLYAEKEGKKVSLFVSSELYTKSEHAMADCIDCHENYNPDEIPHVKMKKEVNCQPCHKDLNGIETSVHSKVKCFDCHSKHNVKSVKEFAKEESSACLTCHNTKVVQGYKTSLHALKNVGCNDCHQSGHGTVKLTKSNSEEVCKKCHKEDHKGFDNTVHNSVLKRDNKRSPTCVDCHGSHELLSTKLSIQSEACLKCHLDDKMFPGDKKGSARFVREYKTSVHGMITDGGNGKEAAGCIDCHGDHIVDKPGDPKASLTKANLLETCGKCHANIVNDFKNSAHGKAYMKGGKDAPSCTKCHGEHSIQSVLKSDRLSKINQADMCLGCHKDTKLPSKNYKGEEELVSHYEKSAHYIALQNGNLKSATCSDCHGAHSMEKADNPDSKIYKGNIAKTCGQADCHVKELGDYTGSVHEKAITEKNNLEAPSCTNCHGNHVILKKDDMANRISSPKGVIQLCSDCHASVEITKKFDLPTNVTVSYNESYHGLATRGGSKEAAFCESCHGNHNIRPSSDTSSSINQKNLPQTCGKCHPGATQTLFTTKIHLTDTETGSIWAYWVRNFYFMMIFGTIGFMVVHNTLDFFRKKRNKKVK
jgi:predicted CXXCH cytochrome family protein